MAQVEKPKVAPAQTDDDKLIQVRERAVIAKFRAACYQGFGVDNEVTAEVKQRANANGEIGHFTKRYMENSYPPLKAVRDDITAARRFHKEKTFKWGDDVVLPTTEILVYRKEMAVFEQNFVIHANEFCVPENYKQFIQDQKHRLGNLWKPSDYPNIDEISGKFKFQSVIEPIPSSKDFLLGLKTLGLSVEQREEIKREYDEEVRAKMTGSVQEVLANLREIVEQLIARTGDPKKAIHNKTFGPLRRIAATLPQLNSIVQDPQIALMAKLLAQDLLSVNVTADADEKQVRKTVRAKADALLATLKPFQTQWQ